MLSKLKLNLLYLKDTQFANLMTRRIFNVLLIANPYDAFMLEDDGRIDEKIFNEYTSLSLRYPPRFTQASTCDEALAQLKNMTYDLIICMPGTGDNEGFDVARTIKAAWPSIPMVILTPFSHGITKRIANEDLSAFEYVFCWLGNTDLLVSIIKLIEDKMNLDHDVKEVGVQAILLVEDSIRFYSSLLPNLYKFVLKQSQEFSTEALNAHQRTLRMRGRPKIVLARNYEEAISIYNKYKNNILGVVTDVRFPRTERGEKDGMAGIRLCAAIREQDPFVPLIIQSSETENMTYASKYGATGLSTADAGDGLGCDVAADDVGDDEDVGVSCHRALVAFDRCARRIHGQVVADRSCYDAALHALLPDRIGIHGLGHLRIDLLHRTDQRGLGLLHSKAVERIHCIDQRRLLLILVRISQKTDIGDAEKLVVVRALHDCQQAHRAALADSMLAIDHDLHQDTGLDATLHDAVDLAFPGQVGGPLRRLCTVADVLDPVGGGILAEGGENLLRLRRIPYEKRLDQILPTGPDDSLERVLVMRGHHCDDALDLMGRKPVAKLLEALHLTPPWQGSL